jgi:general secretion pathway protein C
MRQIFPDRSNLVARVASVLPAVAATVLLGVVVAHWSWIWFAPNPEPRAHAMAESSGSGLAGSLFGDARQGGRTAATTGGTIRLLGIVAAMGGGRGYAVVQIDPKQILAVSEGDEIAPGLRLAEVGVDRIVLDRGGVRETLAWPVKGTAADSVVLAPGK